MEQVIRERVGSLSNLEIHFNPGGWGPVIGEKLPVAFSLVPYAHFDKKEKLGRSADFVSQGSTQHHHRQYNRRRGGEEYAGDFSYRVDAAEDSTFQLVDTSKTQSKYKHPGVKRSQNRAQTGNRGNFTSNLSRRLGSSNNAKNTQQPQDYLSQLARNKMATMRAKYGNNNAQSNRMPRRMDHRNKQDRSPSLAVGEDWQLLEEFDLSQLLKLVANLPQVDDLVWCGHLDQYDDSYEKITTRSSRTLRRSENKLFYNVTSGDDPILQRFAVDGLGEVFATDSILAQLMAAPRSVYSWDLVVQKINGMIFLDKRDDSNFDLLTVSETAVDPPSNSEDVEEFNHPEKLSIEATMINQNFSQQILQEFDQSARKKFESNPFFDDAQSGDEPASVAYRYRKFTLGNLRLVARCELHAWTLRRDEEHYMTVHALNEWDSRYAGGVNWRMKVDQQRGAILATELKNNSAKIAKWTAQALLSGAQLMKMGYVSRAQPNNPYEHVILATQFFKPKELALQINFSLNNMWGIVKTICELLMQKPDGKYVLLKDPNKPILKMYSIPMNSFEEEEEEDGDDNGDAEEETKAADAENK